MAGPQPPHARPLSPVREGVDATFDAPVADESAIPLDQAVILGLIQGPTELLPVSSSAHLSLVPWLAGWDRRAVDAEHRKAFEVALHAGTALALLWGQREVIGRELAAFDGRRAAVLLASFVPPAIAGLAFERAIERRLGGPGATAAGLIAGSAAMVVADGSEQDRGEGDAGPADGVALGFAQAAALMPGISRNGATLTAARVRRFNREHANVLSRTVALPVIVGASLLKGIRLRRRGLPRAQAQAFAAGTGASFVSSLASQALIRLVERDRALWPYAAYRVGLAGAVLAKLGLERRRVVEAPPANGHVPLNGAAPRGAG